MPEPRPANVASHKCAAAALCSDSDIRTVKQATDDTSEVQLVFFHDIWWSRARRRTAL